MRRGWTTEGVEELISLRLDRYPEAEALLQSEGLPSGRSELFQFTNLAPLWKRQWALAAPSPVEGVAEVESPGVVELSAGFNALNAVLAESTGWISLNQKVRRKEHKISQDGGLFANRTFITVSAGVDAVLVEEVQTAEGSWSCSWLEIRLEEGSSLTHERAATGAGDSTTGIVVQCAENARYTLVSEIYGSSKKRLDVEVHLQNKARCSLNALVEGEALHGDHHFDVHHDGHHSVSEQVIRQVLHERSVGVFTGRATVHRGVVGSDATQSCKSMLLGEKAAAKTRPQLMISADEVVASHGATVGQLDEESLFYLRSRGLSQVEATKLLLLGFKGEVLDKLGTTDGL